MNTSENIHIHLNCDSDEHIDLQRLETLVAGICHEFAVSDAFVQVSIVDDTAMTELHRQFLNQSAVTDVMSFDLSDEFESQRNFQIVVNLEQARRQAGRRGHSTEAELALYMTHGLLHQLGYDDVSGPQARAMHKKEDAILQNHGFGVIYHHDEKPNG